MTKSFYLEYGTHPSQFGVLSIPPSSSPCPVVVTIHGGYWKSEHSLGQLTDITNDLNTHGYATWNIEYRRVGEIGAGFPGTFTDIIDAVNYLNVIKHQFKIDLSNVIVLGHSAGGHLALWLASRVTSTTYFPNLTIDIKKVISLSGITDLKTMYAFQKENGRDNAISNFMGGDPITMNNNYLLGSPIELLPFNVEQVLIHGDFDNYVPVEQAISYYDKANEVGEKISIYIIPETDHFMVINPLSLAWKTVIDSLV